MRLFKYIDLIMLVQIACIVSASTHAPEGWKGTVFFSLLLVAVTCEPTPSKS